MKIIYNKFNLILLLLLLLLFIPNVYSFLPEFTNSSPHNYEELINLGINEDLSNNIDSIIISVSSKDTNQVYFSNNFLVSDINFIGFIPSKEFSPNLVVNYKLYSKDNVLIDNLNFILNLEKNKFTSNYIFCKKEICEKDSNFFVFGEDIYLINKNSISDDILYDIKIYNKSNLKILEIKDVYLPYKLNLEPGNYFFDISANYKNKKYLFFDLDLNIIENKQKTNLWNEYFTDINSKTDSNLVIKNNTTDSNLVVINNSNDNNSFFKNKFPSFIYYLFLLLIIIIIFFLIKNKNTKNTDNNIHSNLNRREKRHERK